MKVSQLLLVAIALPLAAAAQDPLKSAACGDALQTLEAARADKAPAARVESLRQGAARACLGTADPPSRAARTAQAPQAVPPPIIEAPRARGLPPPPAQIPPPVAIGRAPGPAICDAGGCWTSEGDQLRYRGPAPGAPGAGPCIAQGGAVVCP